MPDLAQIDDRVVEAMLLRRQCLELLREQVIGRASSTGCGSTRVHRLVETKLRVSDITVSPSYRALCRSKRLLSLNNIICAANALVLSACVIVRRPALVSSRTRLIEIGLLER